MKSRAINTRYVQNLHIPQWQLSGKSGKYKKVELNLYQLLQKLQQFPFWESFTVDKDKMIGLDLLLLNGKYE